MKNNYKYPNIEAERVRHNYSQEQLSELLGIERKSYYNWLVSGKIPATVLVRLADLYDCSIDYMIGYYSSVDELFYIDGLDNGTISRIARYVVM